MSSDEDTGKKSNVRGPSPSLFIEHGFKVTRPELDLDRISTIHWCAQASLVFTRFPG